MKKQRISIFGPACLPEAIVDQETADALERAFDEGEKIEFRDDDGVRYKIKPNAAWAFSSEDVLDPSE